MSHHHFNLIERGKIEILHRMGYSSRAIGKRIERHHSSVARELRRMPNYTAQAAEEDYHKKRAHSRPIGKWREELDALIADKLKATWSPEQIAHTVTSGNVNFKTIYNWLYAGRITGVTSQNLRRKGKKRSCRNLAFYARRTSIRKRPKEVYGRKTFGHWELDTVVPQRGKESNCFATVIERKTRLYTAISMPDRTSASMAQAIKSLFKILPHNAFLSATTDRGNEFACFDIIKRDLGLTLYFADPYCPHQRGSNEYGNGLLREFFPKGTSFRRVSQDTLTHCLFLINSRPRKCLGWISPIQAFLHELSHFN